VYIPTNTTFAPNRPSKLPLHQRTTQNSFQSTTFALKGLGCCFGNVFDSGYVPLAYNQTHHTASIQHLTPSVNDHHNGHRKHAICPPLAFKQALHFMSYCTITNLIMSTTQP